MGTRRDPLKEFARRGDAIYKEKIEPLMTAKAKGKFVSIDIETGEYESARTRMLATNRLYARLPDAQPWVVRVGFPAVVNFGSNTTPLGEAMRATAHQPRKPRYPMKEFSSRGRAIYEKKIEPTLKPKDKGKYVAIDIETGEYEMAPTRILATHGLYGALRAIAGPTAVRHPSRLSRRGQISGVTSGRQSHDQRPRRPRIGTSRVSRCAWRGGSGTKHSLRLGHRLQRSLVPAARIDPRVATRLVQFHRSSRHRLQHSRT